MSALTENKPIIKANNLRKEFIVKIKGETLIHREKKLKAVDGINISVYPGESLGLVGESGCGKTTTAKLLLGLYKPTDGNIICDNEEITGFKGRKLKSFRRKVQMIFQDPYESLNPRFKIKDILKEPLVIHKIGSNSKERYKICKEILEEVGLKPASAYLNRYPHEMSGGQRQRVAIARALILNPNFIIADEPVSMLDVSIRAGILNILIKMIKERNLASICISHDLSLIRYISDRTAVMYLGKIVEQSSTEKLIENRYHPYTEALLEAVPNPDPDHKISLKKIKGEAPSAVDLPSGCRFHTRCIKCMDICKREEPKMIQVEKRHYVMCHLYNGKEV